VVYVDSFKKTAKFFKDKSILEFIEKHKTYSKKPEVRFYYQDYYEELDEELESFDLLISQYAGFITECCKRYLKPKGILVANDSHGDASMALLDEDFQFFGVIYYANKKYYLTDKNLESYFIPKDKTKKISKENLKKTMKGIGYTKYASAYLFKKK
jgi:SAM-dependent methyltransferase